MTDRPFIRPIVLLRFLDRHFSAGDLAAVVTTSGGQVRPRSLTSHRGELRADIQRLRYSLWGMQPPSVFDAASDTFGGVDTFAGAREYQFASSAITLIVDAIEKLKPLPGRKSIVLVSEGFALFGPGTAHGDVLDLMRRLVDRANRAGVVIYALDPRGLVPIGFSAADQNAGSHAARSAALRATQDSLRYLVAQTGGFAVVDSNDLARGMQRIMTDQARYYLIGYEPDAQTLGPTSHRHCLNVTIKVARKGLRVRTRAGFYGVATE